VTLRVANYDVHCKIRMTGSRVRREKAALSSGCEAHPANRSSRKQPEQSCFESLFALADQCGWLTRVTPTAVRRFRPSIALVHARRARSVEYRAPSAAGVPEMRRGVPRGPVLCDQIAKSQPMYSAASGGLVRIQFDSDLDLLRAARSRRTLSRSAAFRGGVVLQAGPRRTKECISLFNRKEDQHPEDRLLANAWSKDYIRVEREGSNRRLVRRESANDANEKVAKAKWPKSVAAGSAVGGRPPLNS
jgi:hypothetical protein